MLRVDIVGDVLTVNGFKSEFEEQGAPCDMVSRRIGSVAFCRFIFWPIKRRESIEIKIEGDGGMIYVIRQRRSA